ncbi:putative manganese transporter [Vallicoccus soli]|uniref:putative manganese transporter n=1 Tax=Vallicoccus soli TaxID=2339232 RepID=UPI0014023009|nr:putative manganese transporter [Vallicoccus soli]
MPTDLVLLPLADSFHEVGLPVLVLVALFGWARLRHGDRLTEWLLRHARLGPAVGAVLGAVPGCGAEIVLVTLLLRRAVSYGTVVAAVVATMGDSAWVLIAADPVLALQVHSVLLVAGVLTGYAVDAARYVPTLPGDPEPAPPIPVGAALGRTLSPALGAAPARPALRLSALSVDELGAPVAALWLLVPAGLVVGLPVVMAQADLSPLTRALGGVDPYLVTGVAGTLAALWVLVAGRGGERCPDAHAPVDLSGVLRGAAREAALVTACVAVATTGWSLLVAATGFDAADLALVGLVGVGVGALVGLVPGCALQIVFTGLFVSGAVPLSTLLANAVSQDGDALFPMLARAPRAAMATSALTTLPALAVGGVALLVL